MATLNPLFGRLKGKYGGSVFYSNSGTQCMRERVLEVGNPKTSKQAIQRAILATVTQFTRAFAPVLNNCIETESGKSKNLAKVRSINMDIVRRIAAESISGGFYTPKGSMVIAPNDYLISRGTLRGLSPIRDAVSRAALTGGALQFQPTDFLIDEDLTAGEVFPTIQVGDQITILAASLEDSDVGSYFGFCRFAFKDNTTPAIIPAEVGSYRLNEAAIDLVKADGPWDKLRFNQSGVRNQMLVGGIFGGSEDENTDIAGLIVSRESQRLRSTAYMLSVDSFPGFSLNEVYPTYMAGGTPIDMPSEVYLNNDTPVVSYFANLPSSLPYVVSLVDGSRQLVKLSTNAPLDANSALALTINREGSVATLNVLYGGAAASSSSIRGSVQWLSNGFLALEGDTGDVSITDGTITIGDISVRIS